MLTIFLILLPLALSLVLFSLKEERTVRMLALAGSIAEFVLTIAAFIQFRTCRCYLLFRADEFAPMGISLNLGLDGTGLLLVAMTALLVPVIILSSFPHRYHRASSFYGLILLMEAAMIGVFSSFDGLVFYVFWELALIPAWFICALWGGHDRIRITFKFFVYTFTGSLLMLVALIWIYLKTPAPHSFWWEWMKTAELTTPEQSWIFAAFFLAFAIKIPIFPFHTWQPDTYTESPPAGSMLLAGIMLKMGLFGIIRWLLPFAPAAVDQWGPVAMGLGITGVVYGSVIAIRQTDMKRLVAYSSIAHVGLIAAGIFTVAADALQGAVIQMVAHGINIVGLFYVLDLIEQRTGTRRIASLGGIASRAPWLATFFMIILLGSVALPLTNGFVGEFLLLLGIFETYPVAAAIAGLTIIFSAVYMLRMYQKIMLGNPVETTENVMDLSPAEMAGLIPLVILIFWMGIYPSFFLDLTLPDITGIVK